VIVGPSKIRRETCKISSIDRCQLSLRSDATSPVLFGIHDDPRNTYLDLDPITPFPPSLTSSLRRPNSHMHTYSPGVVGAGSNDGQELLEMEKGMLTIGLKEGSGSSTGIQSSSPLACTGALRFWFQDPMLSYHNIIIVKYENERRLQLTSPS
jgi:hypothetical protein